VEPLAGPDSGGPTGYRVQAPLGLGDVGPAYLASAVDGRPVVVVLVRPEFAADRGFRDRLAEQVAAARTIQSPHLVPILDADLTGEAPWLVTAHVPGPSLQQAITQYGPMPTGTALFLVSAVAQALAAAHGEGLVHGALRPSAVLLAPSGPQVAGLALAQAVEASLLARDAARGEPVRHSSPEQIAGARASAASDVFALGHLAAFAVLGRSPFGTGDQVAVSHRILNQEPDLAGCPETIAELLEGCLAKDPSARPAAADVVEFCRAHAPAQAPLWPAPVPAGPPGSAMGAVPPNTAPPNSPPPGAPAPPPWWRRIPRAVAVGSLAGVVLVAAAIGAAVLLTQPSNSSPAAAITTRSPSPNHTASTAPTASAAPIVPVTPASSIDPCLLGTWKGVSENVTNKIDDNSVQFTGSGPATATFAADGTATTAWGKGEVLTATVNGDKWTETVKGTATMHIETRGGMMLTSNVVAKGTWTLADNGSTNNSGALSIDSSPSPYSCIGNTLREYDSSGGAVVFARVSH